GTNQNGTPTFREASLSNPNFISRGGKIGKAVAVGSSRQTGTVYSPSGVRHSPAGAQPLLRFLLPQGFTCQAVERLRKRRIKDCIRFHYVATRRRAEGVERHQIQLSVPNYYEQLFFRSVAQRADQRIV